MNELYSAHPAMFRANPVGFTIAVFLIFAFGIGVVILLYWFLQTMASKLTITDDELLYEKGLLSKERVDVNMDMVKTVKVKQSFMNRIFGVGDIEIYTTGDIPEFVITAMPNPNEIRNLIKKKQHGDEIGDKEHQEEPVIDKQGPPQQIQQENSINSDKTVYNASTPTQLPYVKSVTLLSVGQGIPLLTVFQDNKIVLGRSVNANIVINNQYVSGQHLSLSLNQSDEVVVVDLGSSNGTYIQGIKLIPHQEYILHQNEHLIVGSEDVVYSL